jgi:hypothetical protein
MSDEADITQRPGWKAVERWLSENEPPQPKPRMRDPIAKWGTRGLIAGCVAGFGLSVLAPGGGSSEKMLLGIAIMTGLLGVPCAVAGMLVGFAIWLFGRS